MWEATQERSGSAQRGDTKMCWLNAQTQGGGGVDNWQVDWDSNLSPAASWLCDFR